MKLILVRPMPLGYGAGQRVLRMDHKYVRHSKFGFVLWPSTDEIWHLHVCALLSRAGGEIESAGFVRFIGNMPECFGDSKSLGISSQSGDSDALAKQLGIAPNPALIDQS